MPWPRTILVTAVLFAFGFFFALPAEDASETAFDESASAFCEITPSLILDPLGKAVEVGGKTFRTRRAQSEDSGAATNKPIDTCSPSMSLQALNQLLRC